MVHLQDEFDGLPDFMAAEVFFEPEGTVAGEEKEPDNVNIFSAFKFEKAEYELPVLESVITSSAEFFDPEKGKLRDFARHSNRAYEFRPGQKDMAEAIAAALADGKNLVIEAPTGIGKSFAYLVPLIYWSKMLPHPALVSTGTIHLQEQLIKKDIPMLAKLTGIDFKAAIAKGRSNYLCRRRLELAVQKAGAKLFDASGCDAELERIAKWSRTCVAGDRDEAEIRFDSKAWELVACEAGSCMSPRCPHLKKCFYWNARLSWEKANIVVANHALFFANMKLENSELADAENAGGGILPRFSAAVIDEAHTLEDSAADHLGLRISEPGLLACCNRLYNPDTGYGLLMRPGALMPELRAMTLVLRDKAKVFFKIVGQFLAQTGDSVREVSEGGLFPDELTPLLRELRLRILDAASWEEDTSVKTELEGAVGRIAEFADSLSFFIERSVADFVYWVENEQDFLVLHAAPLSVANILRFSLFRRSYPVMLTSATLRVNGKFDYYTGRIGYEGRQPIALESPFNAGQVKLFLPERLPDPSHEDYLNMLLYFIPRCVDATGGGCLVLFTSYSVMLKCAGELKEELQAMGYPLFLQDGSRSRTALLNDFKNTPNSVLFGTDSFWTGVDVPGDALRNVIVTKLPFAVPTQPLVKARCEKITASGGNAFMEYSVPEAILKLRQGVGRLIRTAADKGMITILDSRILTRRYGGMFLRSLPDYPRIELDI